MFASRSRNGYPEFVSFSSFPVLMYRLTKNTPSMMTVSDALSAHIEGVYHNIVNKSGKTLVILYISC